MPREADLVCYWFEKAREAIAREGVRRAGLIATNSIRGGANRLVLDRVKESGDIFMAWSDESWILDGAAVRVSIVGFDDGSEEKRVLDGVPVSQVNSSLANRVDVAKAQRLASNMGKSFMGTTKGGPFDIPGELARSWLDLPNPSGRSNRDVVRPWINGLDLTRRPRDMWIIDFTGLSEEEASTYAVPWAYVSDQVKPARIGNARASYAERWWQFMEPRPAMVSALKGLDRYLCTPRVAKHRTFVWVPSGTVPDSAVIAFAADDDYTFGVLHSHLHEVWSLAQGTSLGAGNDPRYTPSTTFETFPFPERIDRHWAAVSAAASHLNELRNHLLDADAALTPTKLYNEVMALKQDRDATARAFPLLIAHERMDRAVTEAYGWHWPLSDDEALSKLLELSLQRESAEAS